MSKYAIVDLEMCNVPKGPNGRYLQIRNEIIQIGAVLVDESLNIVGTFCTLVAPQYGRIDRFIRRLTGISQQDTQGAPTVEVAMKQFFDWLPEDAVLVSWSDSDKAQVVKELEFKGISFPEAEAYLDGWIDCQRDFGVKMHAERRCYSLSEALIIAAVDYEDGAHNALVDARNTAKLFVKMQKEDTLQTVYSFYGSAESVKPATHNPFADLLAGVAV